MYRFVAQHHMFLLHSRDGKKVILPSTFFQSLASDDVKVNKTQRISTRSRLIVWILMETSEFALKLRKMREEVKVTENSHAMF